MRYPVGKGTKYDFEKYWYLADVFGSYREVTSSAGVVTFRYYHSGVDINLRTGGNTDLGEAIKAISKGRMVYYHRNSHPTRTYGRHNVYEIKGSFGTRWVHSAHCTDQDFVAAVKELNEGDMTGRIGNTGNSYSAHLHFTIYRVDPKTLRNGIDTVPVTPTELDNWFEDPITFIEKYLKEDSMPDAGMVELPSKKFEELVTKSTFADSVYALGYTSAAQIEADVKAYKEDLKKCREETQIQRERAEANRKEYIALLAKVSKVLKTVQEPVEAYNALDRLNKELNDFSDLKIAFAALQLSGGEKVEDLQTEINRLKLLKSSLDDATMEELIGAIIKKLKNIIRS